MTKAIATAPTREGLILLMAQRMHWTNPDIDDEGQVWIGEADRKIHSAVRVVVKGKRWRLEPAA